MGGSVAPSSERGQRRPPLFPALHPSVPRLQGPEQPARLLSRSSAPALPPLPGSFPPRALPPALQVFTEAPALLPPYATTSLLSFLDNHSSSHNGAFLALAQAVPRALVGFPHSCHTLQVLLSPPQPALLPSPSIWLGSVPPQVILKDPQASLSPTPCAGELLST